MKGEVAQEFFNLVYRRATSSSANRAYSANGLNQYTASGSVVPTYDEKANLASAGGSATYAYSTKNELVYRSVREPAFITIRWGNSMTSSAAGTGSPM